MIHVWIQLFICLFVKVWLPCIQWCQGGPDEVRSESGDLQMAKTGQLQWASSPFPVPFWQQQHRMGVQVQGKPLKFKHSQSLCFGKKQFYVLHVVHLLLCHFISHVPGYYVLSLSKNELSKTIFCFVCFFVLLLDI